MSNPYFNINSKFSGIHFLKQLLKKKKLFSKQTNPKSESETSLELQWFIQRKLNNVL